MATSTAKFGISQLTCKTPAFGHWIPQFYILFSVSGLEMLTALGVSPDMETKIAKIAIAFSPLFVLIGQCFGISIPAQGGSEQSPVSEESNPA